MALDTKVLANESVPWHGTLDQRIVECKVEDVKKAKVKNWKAKADKDTCSTVNGGPE